MIKDVWSNEVAGYRMFKIVRKMQDAKKPLRKRMWENGNINDGVKKLRVELHNAQVALDCDPDSMELHVDENGLLKAFNDALL